MGNKSVWEIIYDYLNSKNLNVYPPAAHSGECKERYCVLKSNGGNQFGTFSTQIEYYTLICYVPQNKYHELKSYMMECEKALNELSPMIMPTGQSSPDFFDDMINAHTNSLTYRNYRRNKLL